VLLRILNRLEETLIAFLMGAATIVIFFAILQRYASGVPALYPYARTWDFTWAQELCIYMFVWMCKFGAAYGVRTGIHVGVDVFIKMLGIERRRTVILFGLCCGALFGRRHSGHPVAHGKSGDVAGPRSADVDRHLCVPWLLPMCFRFLQVACVSPQR
jgi:C4-dicarboxylate transporter DctQ subunit